MIDYENKYLKYKQKYLMLKNNKGGTIKKKKSKLSKSLLPEVKLIDVVKKVKDGVKLIDVVKKVKDGVKLIDVVKKVKDGVKLKNPVNKLKNAVTKVINTLTLTDPKNIVKKMTGAVKGEKKIYDSSNISTASASEINTTTDILAKAADSTRKEIKSSRERADGLQKEIENSKKIRSTTFIISSASNGLTILPGGIYLAGALNMANKMASAYTDSLKFKELLYDTMIILTNCYKIFVLINRATDTFTIAIHNKKGLDDLYKMIISADYDDKKYNSQFMIELEQANKKKETHREKIKNDLHNSYYLLDNIHQSHEIKEEIKIKMERLIALLLESAPDSIILTLYLDNTLKQQGFENLIMNECIQRRSDKNIKNTDFCITNENEIKENENKIKENENEIKENENKKFINRIKTTASTVAKKLTSKKFFNKMNKISDSSEKMQETLVALSVINGLFIIMKTQYDEARSFYEKHLDNILSLPVNSNSNKIIKQRVLGPADLTIYEKANHIIEFSNEYINFMVPPLLQSTINETINTIKPEYMKEAMVEVGKNIKENHENDINSNDINSNDINSNDIKNF